MLGLAQSCRSLENRLISSHPHSPKARSRDWHSQRTTQNGRVIRRVFPAIVFTILAVGAAAAQQSQIKGFYIGMSKADVLRLKPTVFIIKESAPEEGMRGTILQFQATDGDTSAEFTLTPGNTVRSFFLAKSYFNASDMTTDQFYQAILDQYPIQKVTCGYITIEAMPGRFCRGLTSEGDVAKLTPDGIEIIGRSGQKPRP
jgi:hypothetical protein